MTKSTKKNPWWLGDPPFEEPIYQAEEFSDLALKNSTRRNASGGCPALLGRQGKWSSARKNGASSRNIWFLIIQSMVFIIKKYGVNCYKRVIKH